MMLLLFMFHFIRVFYEFKMWGDESMFVVYLSLVELDKSRHPLNICISVCSIHLILKLNAENDIVIFGQPKNLFKQ